MSDQPHEASGNREPEEYTGGGGDHGETQEMDKLLFEQSNALLERQGADLDELRTRAGVLLAGMSVATAFLGDAVLDLRAELALSALLAAWAGFGLFVVGCIFVILVIIPRGDWIFSALPSKLDTNYRNDRGAPKYRAIALQREEHYKGNKRRLEKLTWYFAGGCVALVLEVLLWLTALYFSGSQATLGSDQSARAHVVEETARIESVEPPTNCASPEG